MQLKVHFAENLQLVVQLALQAWLTYSIFWVEKIVSLGNQNRTRGVSYCGLAICIKKYRKAKEKLFKLKYFFMQKYNLQKQIL
jgi:hypothetical protein